MDHGPPLSFNVTPGIERKASKLPGASGLKVLGVGVPKSPKWTRFCISCTRLDGVNNRLSNALYRKTDATGPNNWVFGIKAHRRESIGFNNEI